MKLHPPWPKLSIAAVLVFLAVATITSVALADGPACWDILVTQNCVVFRGEILEETETTVTMRILSIETKQYIGTTREGDIVTFSKDQVQWLVRGGIYAQFAALKKQDQKLEAQINSLNNYISLARLMALVSVAISILTLIVVAIK